jgi:CBS domain containing-hemolysin-like protein
MLQVQRTTLGEVMVPIAQTASVTEHTTARAIERRSLQCGRSRFPVTDLRGGYVGLVHIRDAMRATARGENPPARELMGPVLTLPASMPVARAVTEMRDSRAQLALVEDGEVVGIAALEDLLEELIGDFEDETDTRPVGVR